MNDKPHMGKTDEVALNRVLQRARRRTWRSAHDFVRRLHQRRRDSPPPRHHASAPNPTC